MAETQEAIDSRKDPIFDVLPPIFDVLPPIFRECVDPDPSLGKAKNYHFAMPFRIGDYVYATDARIGVRTPANAEIIAMLRLAPKEKRFPAADSVFGPANLHHSEPTPLPSLDHLDRCPACSGSGQLAAGPCDFCEGRGIAECSQCEDADECPRCAGHGRLPAGGCVWCCGGGIDEPQRSPVEVGKDIALMANYLLILRRYRAAIYLPVETPTDKSTTPVRFTVGDDVEGVVMPVSNPDPKGGRR